MRLRHLHMKTAQRIIDQFPDVIFFVVGNDRICYGGDDTHLGGEKSFKNWTLGLREIRPR